MSTPFCLTKELGGVRAESERDVFVLVPAGSVLRILRDGAMAGTVVVFDGENRFTVFASDLFDRSDIVTSAAIAEHARSSARDSNYPEPHRSSGIDGSV